LLYIAVSNYLTMEIVAFVLSENAFNAIPCHSMVEANENVKAFNAENPILNFKVVTDKSKVESYFKKWGVNFDEFIGSDSMV